MDEDDAVAGLHQVLDHPPRRRLAGRRVVHREADGALPGRHVCESFWTKVLKEAVSKEEVLGEGRLRLACGVAALPPPLYL